MRARKRLASGLFAGLLVASLISAGDDPVSGAGTGLGAVSALSIAGQSHTVALITGDRVTVGGGGGVSVRQGKGREHITFLTRRHGEHHYVIPSDALPLIGAGRLDRRLFDIALLKESGYHKRDELPLIVTGESVAASGRARTATTAAGAKVVRALPAVNGVAARVGTANAGEFWNGLTGGTATRSLAAGVSTVWLDGLRQPLLEHSVPQVGAPAAWQAGLDGSGVTVAVLDTGIDRNHPDLAGRIVASENFTEGVEDDRDLVGHGTHVASIVAGSGAASGGRYRGVAPGASLLDGKVCVEWGCPESWVLAGMRWAAERGASVVNLSLGGTDEPGLDLLEQAVQTLTDQYGVLFVIAAGNEGEDAPVSSPASADAALAVGAVDRRDALADFSSRGPRIDGALKPDLTAPGVDIMAARSADGYTRNPGEPYTSLSGTSMATPHVAGAAAILAQQHPKWTPQQRKAVLMSSAAPNPALGPYAQGAGRLDVARAVSQRVTTSPPSVSFDHQLWPRHDDPVQTRTITYFNHGAHDVTLALELATAGPDGGPVPSGMFRLGASTLNVPAGGSAEVSLTADTSLIEVSGYFGGRVTASAAGIAVTAPFAVSLESEAYDVTLTHTDRAGELTSGYYTGLYRRDGTSFMEVAGSDAEVTIRVPRGEYFLVSDVAVNNADHTVLVHPKLLVDRDTSVAIDARKARPISVTVPDPAARQVYAQIGGAAQLAHGTVQFGRIWPGSFKGMFAGRLGPDQSVEGLVVGVTSAWAKPSPGGGFHNSPYVYDLAWFTVGRMISGFERAVHRSNLATVVAEHAVQVPGAVGWKWTHAVAPGGIFPYPLPAHGISGDLPLRRVEYQNTDGGGQWHKYFWEVLRGDEGEEEFIGELGSELAGTVYLPGRRYHERWNYGVQGPTLPGSTIESHPHPPVRRTSDRLMLAPPLYGDGAGHWGTASTTGTITVHRNGELIAEEPWIGASVEVSPEPANYRVQIEAQRSGPATLSTKTSLVWRFRSGHKEGSGHGGGPAVAALPVSVVRFSPKLDEHNRAPAGQPFLVPLTVDRQPGSPEDPVTRLSVQVSYDDGRTWSEAPVLAGQYVQLRHPDNEGFVSLRATAQHRDGSVVEQTIIRAYRIS